MTDQEKRARFRRQMCWVVAPIWGLCLLAGKMHALPVGQIPRGEALLHIGMIALIVLCAALIPPLEEARLRRRSCERVECRPPLDLAS